MAENEDNKIRSQERVIAQWRNDKRKFDEESLCLYGLVKKVTEKLMNQISNFEELECKKSSNINR